MGIRDLFSKKSKVKSTNKKDYASEFKNNFEMKNFNETGKIIKEWYENYSHDLNCIYATVIMKSMTATDGTEIESMKELFNNATMMYAPENESLRPWFEKTARQILSTGQYSPDEGYARKFRDVYERNMMLNQSGEITDEQTYEIIDLVNEWGEKFPNDLNYHLAYNFLMSAKWSSEKTQNTVDHLCNTYTPLDTEINEWIIRIIDATIEAKIRQNM